MFLCVDRAQYTRTAARWDVTAIGRMCVCTCACTIVRTCVRVWMSVSMCMTARRWMNSLHSNMWFCLWTVFSSTIRAHKQSFACCFFSSSFEFEFNCVSVRLPLIHGTYYQFSRLERNNRDNDIYVHLRDALSVLIRRKSDQKETMILFVSMEWFIRIECL